MLASTRGTDLQAIIDEIKKGALKVELACVISNKEYCYALERARTQGFKTYFVNPRQTDGSKKDTAEFDAEMLEILESHAVDLVVLVGFMRILGSSFIQRFKNRIINVHPALIPKFCGKEFFGNNVHQAVLDAKEKETGMTIHFVEDGVDTGKIILQKKIAVTPTDTVETLKEKVQALEKEWYPKVIGWIRDNLY